MIKKRKCVVFCALLILIFIASTNYLLSGLLAQNEQNHFTQEHATNIHQEILKQVEHLPEIYTAAALSEAIIDGYIKNLNTFTKTSNTTSLWSIANSWVRNGAVVDFSSPQLGNVVRMLKNARITKADLASRGTQLKLFLTLDGNQQVYFKPQWYNKEKIIEGPVYSGKDRYGSEIVAFYLSILLNMPYAPLSTERSISLTKDVLPVATKRLKNTTFYYNNKACVYGACFYCKKEDPVCEDESFSLNGAMILNIEGILKKHPSPWRRTYTKKSKAIWEDSQNYCNLVREKLPKSRILDLIDTAIFDFLIQNGDRHHYETLADKVLLLDNGKGFGNPHVHHLDILAPLYQCCSLRNKTFERLKSLAGGNFKKQMSTMPDINNLITDLHMDAIEQRLLIVFATVEYCRNRNVKRSIMVSFPLFYGCLHFFLFLNRPTPTLVTPTQLDFLSSPLNVANEKSLFVLPV